jgi:hypothetical protein
MPDSTPSQNLQIKISRNEAAAVDVDLTGKRGPRQRRKSGRWNLNLSPIAIASLSRTHRLIHGGRA